MKQEGTGPKSIAKGAPSGFIISLLVHAGAFLLAGLLVVFTVVHKEEKKFEPPQPIDRPKMKLKKPKVKVKKTSKPQSTTRIVTKVQKADMPEIQLPELGGMGTGLEGGSGIDGFDMTPDISTLSPLGNMRSIGSDLEGTFYDFKRDRRGGYIGMEIEYWRQEIINFLRNDWRISEFSRYYRSPNKIYATSLVVPPVLSSIAPTAFGDKDAAGVMWLVHYKGQLVHKDGIRFRFWGHADETMAVRVGGDIVLGVRWESPDGDTNVDPDTIPADLWESASIDSRKYIIGNSRAVVGDWITLEPGVPQPIEIIIGDNGGQACFMLAVQEEGVEYPTSPQGGPILPAFKTAEISRDLLDVIYKDLVDGELDLVNGPIFNDYYSAAPATDQITAAELEGQAATAEPAPEPDAPRLWALQGGENIEAELVNVMSQTVILKNAQGKMLKIPMAALNDADREFVELSRPPDLNINFTKNCEQKLFTNVRYAEDRPAERRCHYGVRIRQTGTGDYNHELTAEIFVIGEERLGQKNMLLDRQQTSFSLTRANKRSHEFRSGREVVLENYLVDDEERGETYAGYLVVVTDKRGTIISVDTSDDWLYENFDNLKKLRTGNYLDRKCNRVFPTRPPPTRY